MEGKNCLCNSDSKTLEGALEDLEIAFKNVRTTVEVLKRKRSKLPRFYGYHTENIRHFLSTCDSYLVQDGGFTDNEKIDLVFNLLHGPARSFGEVFLYPDIKGERVLSYREFQCALITEFNKKK